MVRFSEIIKLKNKKNGLQKTSGGLRSRNDGFRLSESQPVNRQEDKQVVREEAEIVKRDTIVEVITYYEIFIEKIQNVKEQILSDGDINPSPILIDLHAVIDKDIIEDLYEYAMSVTNDYDQIFVHIVEVTLTALMVGKGLKYDIEKLIRLGLAAFLENVGMFKIPPEILAADKKLSDDERKIIKGHPEKSYEILMNLEDEYDWLAETALRVHERYDGSGYPSGLKGEEIPELSSIIGLVDTYIAMIRKRPHRDNFIQFEAIKSIVERNREQFSGRILKAFLNQISFFPINSYVRLNNGSIGRVVSILKDKPLRPTIELLIDSKGNKLTNKQVIRLDTNMLLFINMSINPDAMTQ